MSLRLVLPLILLALAGCMHPVAPPPGLDLSLTRPTEQSKYIVELQPPAEPIRVNKIHAWEVKISSPAGEPISSARINVGGGMPQHRHGLPTRPRVTQELGDGHYLIEGMKFNMTGWWEIKLNIQSPIGADQVTFNTVIEVPTRAASSGSLNKAASNDG
jgi:hypothetical protein